MTLLKTYANHTPAKENIQKIKQIREAFSECHKAICAIAPECRERSVALTNLEQSCMWATKAVAVNDPQAAIDY